VLEVDDPMFVPRVVCLIFLAPLCVVLFWSSALVWSTVAADVCWLVVDHKPQSSSLSCILHPLVIALRLCKVIQHTATLRNLFSAQLYHVVIEQYSTPPRCVIYFLLNCIMHSYWASGFTNIFRNTDRVSSTSEVCTNDVYTVNSRKVVKDPRRPVLLYETQTFINTHIFLGSGVTLTHTQTSLSPFITMWAVMTLCCEVWTFAGS
jgi:hypothetical protein